MQLYTITILIDADSDPSEILEYAIESGRLIVQKVEDHGGSADFLEEEVAVVREADEEVYGGYQNEK